MMPTQFHFGMLATIPGASINAIIPGVGASETITPTGSNQQTTVSAAEGINIATINTWIKNTYGSKAVDVVPTLVGADPNGVPLAAYVIDEITDPAHFNTTANGLIAPLIETALVANGW